MAPDTQIIRVIAHARNGFSSKFGIPRQSREESLLLTRIVFVPDYRVREALRGIEDYSHLWLIWGFSENKEKESWSPTVRPPRLGGNTRMGVFATRSPYRPNPIGLTSVRLLKVEELPNEGLTLLVSGADLLDGTPIFDIKPYLSFSDSHPDAKNGFAEAPKDYRLEVVWDEFPGKELQRLPRPSLKAELNEILSQDPRPAYQDDPSRMYGLVYDGFEVHFEVKENRLLVKNITQR